MGASEMLPLGHCFFPSQGISPAFLFLMRLPCVGWLNRQKAPTAPVGGCGSFRKGECLVGSALIGHQPQ